MIPWLIAGDFNAVLDPSEKFGGNRANWSHISAFRNCLSKCGLQDLGFCGASYTWSNRCPGNYICGRLDRACGNLDWFRKFPNSIVRHLSVSTSDHKPKLIDMIHALI